MAVREPFATRGMYHLPQDAWEVADVVLEHSRDVVGESGDCETADDQGVLPVGVLPGGVLPGGDAGDEPLVMNAGEAEVCCLSH